MTDEELADLREQAAKPAPTVPDVAELLAAVPVLIDALAKEKAAREEAERRALVAEENDKVSREYLEIDAKRIKAAEARATTAEAENARLRTIISEATAAIGNGAFASPDCTIEFLALVPAEIKISREKAKAETARLRERVKALEEAGRHILPYLRFTVGPESPGHHPTMPSAVAAFEAAIRSHKENNDAE